MTFEQAPVRVIPIKGNMEYTKHPDFLPIYQYPPEWKFIDREVGALVNSSTVERLVLEKIDAQQ